MSAATVGIVGAGQLARMTAQAAISLAVDTVVLAVNASDPACIAATTVLLGSPDDAVALAALAARCDVITFDHEGVDPDMVAQLEAAGCLVLPSSRVLRFADKAHQRRELEALGLPVPPFRVATHLDEIEKFGAVHGWPVVAKLATGGYDGRGVFVLADLAEARRLLADVDGRTLVLEPLLDIRSELAVVVARRPSGHAVAYPVVETRQVRGICVETVTPPLVTSEVAAEATRLALEIAEAIDVAGILAVEFFVVPAGLLVNELAPRPHNSGHWTIEGSTTSQFENHLRGVLDWSLGDTSATAPAVAMVNVLGSSDDADPMRHLAAALEVEGARVHLYAKRHAPGRKLGHVTALGPDQATALDRARACASVLMATTAQAKETADGR